MSVGGLRRIPARYLLTLGIALSALPHIGIGIGSILLLRRGSDPFDSFNLFGLPCLIVAFVLGYAMRLIFWRRSSPSLIAGTRIMLTAALGLTGLATVYLVAVAFGSRQTPGWTWIFITYAAFALIANVVWIARYRNLE